MKLTVNRSSPRLRPCVRAGMRAARAVLVAAAGAALLASCGGGSQVESFVPSRIVAFGDESSVINADGSKYTVNAVIFDASVSPPVPTTAIDCAGNPIWVQAVASTFGLVFPQCNPLSVVAPVSRIYAFKNAVVADLATQIDVAVANGGFAAGDMATVFIGANDVVAQFSQYPGVGEAQLGDNAEQAGKALALQVNRLAALGAKVLISTIPDMGLTPFAGDRSGTTVNTGTGVLSRLSTRFNDALLANLLNDGHKIGLVQLDEYMKAVDRARILGGGSFANTSLAACLPAAPLPLCTTQTLGDDAAAVPPPVAVSTASGATWLWADALHLSAGGQASLGSLAVTRARANPF